MSLKLAKSINSYILYNGNISAAIPFSIKFWIRTDSVSSTETFFTLSTFGQNISIQFCADKSFNVILPGLGSFNTNNTTTSPVATPYEGGGFVKPDNTTWCNIEIRWDGSNMWVVFNGYIFSIVSNISYSAGITLVKVFCNSVANAYIYNFIYNSSSSLPAVTRPVSTALPTDMNNYIVVIYAILKDTIINGGIRQVSLADSYIVKTGTLAGNFNITNDVTVNDSIPSGATAPQATICFVAGTTVLTDNEGYVPIDSLIPDHHIINGEQVLAVTQTVTPERHLVMIRKDALSQGVPCQDTKVSINHKILMDNGDMTEAGKLLGLSGVHLIDYHQETLYNVVLPTHGKMTVNNMIVETLNPEFLLAKLFIAMKNMPQDQRDNLTLMYNNYVKYLLAKI
jgi:hypothetical protein